MNTSTTDPYTGEAINPALRMTLLTIGWVACVSGVLGNVLIIATLLSQPALRSLHNLYIGNLAVADLIISSYSVPFWLLDLGGGRHPVANSAHCVCNAFITCCAFSTSVLTLVVISFNRYLSVCHHALFVRVFSRRRTLALCLLTWVLGFSFCAPNLFLLRPSTTGYDSRFRICSFGSNVVGNYSTWYTVVLLLLPSFIVGFSNVSIFVHWKKSRARLHKWRTKTSTASDGGGGVGGGGKAGIRGSTERKTLVADNATRSTRDGHPDSSACYNDHVLVDHGTARSFQDGDHGVSSPPVCQTQVGGSGSGVGAGVRESYERKTLVADDATRSTRDGHTDSSACYNYHVLVDHGPARSFQDGDHGVSSPPVCQTLAVARASGGDGRTSFSKASDRQAKGYDNTTKNSRDIGANVCDPPSCVTQFAASENVHIVDHAVTSPSSDQCLETREGELCAEDLSSQDTRVALTKTTVNPSDEVIGNDKVKIVQPRQNSSECIIQTGRMDDVVGELKEQECVTFASTTHDPSDAPIQRDEGKHVEVKLISCGHSKQDCNGVVMLDGKGDNLAHGLRDKNDVKLISDKENTAVIRSNIVGDVIDEFMDNATKISSPSHEHEISPASSDTVNKEPRKTNSGSHSDKTSSVLRDPNEVCVESQVIPSQADHPEQIAHLINEVLESQGKETAVTETAALMRESSQLHKAEPPSGENVHTKQRSGGPNSSDTNSKALRNRNNNDSTTKTVKSRQAKKSPRSNFSANDVSMIQSLLIVFVCCVFLYLPLATMAVIYLYSHVYIDTGVWTVACAFLNHSINWILYGLMNRSFREGYVRQFGCCCRKCRLKS